MRVKGITAEQLKTIVNNISYGAYDGNVIFNRDPDTIGNFHHFTLRVKDSSGPGARQSARGRKTVSACWHVHRDIMRAIFGAFPDAILVSALARYDGKAGFLADFAETGNINVGSMLEPRRMRDCCNC
jgi:hypothetical protein